MNNSLSHQASLVNAIANGHGLTLVKLQQVCSGWRWEVRGKGFVNQFSTLDKAAHWLIHGARFCNGLNRMKVQRD